MVCPDELRTEILDVQLLSLVLELLFCDRLCICLDSAFQFTAVVPAAVVDSVQILAYPLGNRSIDIRRRIDVAPFSMCLREVGVLREVDVCAVFDHPSTTDSVVEQSIDLLLVVVDCLARVFADERDEPVTDILIRRNDVEQKRSEVLGCRLIDQRFDVDRFISFGVSVTHRLGVSIIDSEQDRDDVFAVARVVVRTTATRPDPIVYDIDSHVVVVGSPNGGSDFAAVDIQFLYPILVIIVGTTLERLFRTE